MIVNKLLTYIQFGAIPITIHKVLLFLHRPNSENHEMEKKSFKDRIIKLKHHNLCVQNHHLLHEFALLCGKKTQNRQGI